MSVSLHFNHLPEVAIEKIFSFLSYDEIAQNRVVCRAFNQIGGRMLTTGFLQIEKRHAAKYKNVKSQLPRRPSERRSHLVVSRYCEILQGMETRIRMLNVTYMRYIEQHLICFIPGKVLDEIQHLLRLIDTQFNPPSNNNQLLEELRDLSSMAMEHFDEHILPNTEKKESSIYSMQPSTSTLNMNIANSVPQGLINNEIQKVKRKSKIQKHHIIFLADKIQKINQKLQKQTILMRKQHCKIRDQNIKLQIQTSKLETQENMIINIKKELDDLQKNCSEIRYKVEARNIISGSSVEKYSSSYIQPTNVYKSCLKNRPLRNLPIKQPIMKVADRRKITNVKEPQESLFVASTYRSHIKPRMSKIFTKDSANLLRQYLDLKSRLSKYKEKFTLSLPPLNILSRPKTSSTEETYKPTAKPECTNLLGKYLDENYVEKIPSPKILEKNNQNLVNDLERKRKKTDYEIIPSKVARNDIDDHGVEIIYNWENLKEKNSEKSEKCEKIKKNDKKMQKFNQNCEKNEKIQKNDGDSKKSETTDDFLNLELITSFSNPNRKRKMQDDIDLEI